MRKIYFQTSLGMVGVEWSADKLLGISLESGACQVKETEELSFGEILAYFRGEKVDFGHYQLDLSDYTPFTRLVLEKCREIPYGEVISYQELSRRIGKPQAARAVGNALGKNRYPVVIPCHRVVCRSGKLGGFSAGVNWKQKLIEWERSHF